MDLYILGLDAFQQAYICMEAIIQGDYFQWEYSFLYTNQGSFSINIHLYTTTSKAILLGKILPAITFEHNILYSHMKIIFVLT